MISLRYDACIDVLKRGADRDGKKRGRLLLRGECLLALACSLVHKDPLFSSREPTCDGRTRYNVTTTKKWVTFLHTLFTAYTAYSPIHHHWHKGINKHNNTAVVSPWIMNFGAECICENNRPLHSPPSHQEPFIYFSTDSIIHPPRRIHSPLVISLPSSSFDHSLLNLTPLSSPSRDSTLVLFLLSLHRTSSFLWINYSLL
ncbi:hypothetical protein BC939DRAFT_80577 [Gamsiella multidivaricata]|uniref:uncharacterized protein n=1 Tax=Gamsiella multidivaricata TaxID=101098 RepID=UPI002220808E|nr:uncharacterized protein BC939DRAFT_80577 [Gamsiella multidivaricata]KAI7815875.1 hypothetical protein BC939DRAFT_80577 [Gamsiella multidivaricata]